MLSDSSPTINNALKKSTGWTSRGSKPWKKKRYISSTNRPESLLFHEYRGSFPVMKRPGRIVDPSPKSSVLVKNGVTPLLPVYAFMAWTGKGCS
jgi:hypothetical protein